MRHQTDHVQQVDTVHEKDMAVLHCELTRLHEPTSCPAEVLARLTRTPLTMKPLPGAHMLDLALTVSHDVAYANVRSATAAPFDQVVADTHAQLGGLTVATTARSAVIEANGMRATVDDYYTFRAVRWHVRDVVSDRAGLIERYGQWHRGAAPVGNALPCGVSIETFADGPRPANIALYTTRYEFSEPTAAVRGRIDRELARAGWSVAEPRSNSLFLRGPFDAEVHVLSDPAAGTTMVDFVGEFSLS